LFCQPLFAVGINYEVAIDGALHDYFVRSVQGEVGTLEVGNNGGKRVEGYLASVGLRKGNPYCAAFLYWNMQRASENTGIPNILQRTGLANGQYNHLKNIGKRTDKPPQRGDIITWKYRIGSSGHIGMVSRVIDWDKGIIETIEANTSADNSSPDGRLNKGKQGVFIKKRYIKTPLGQMNFRGFSQFKKK
jgi:hypothetical protein